MLSLRSRNSCVYQWGFCMSVCVCVHAGVEGYEGVAPDSHECQSTGNGGSSGSDLLFLNSCYSCSCSHARAKAFLQIPKWEETAGSGCVRGGVFIVSHLFCSLSLSFLRGFKRELFLPRGAQVSALSQRKELAQRSTL